MKNFPNSSLSKIDILVVKIMSEKVVLYKFNS